MIKFFVSLAPLTLLAACQANAQEGRSPPPIPTKANAQGDFVFVDKSERLLFVFKDGKEVARFTDIRFGDVPEGHKQFEGDEKTPEGNYIIDSRNPGSRYHLSLHINYPNKTDQRFAASKGKPPGGDIFIHGQPNAMPDEMVLKGDWTAGCIAVSNAQMREIWAATDADTLVEVRP